MPEQDQTQTPVHAGNRLGTRTPHPELTLTVLVPEQRRLRGTRQVPVIALVIDLSVTGARLDLGEAPPVEAGARLAVQHGPGHGVVVVRHLARTQTGQQCGVEFVHLDAHLRETVYRRLAEDSDVPEWRAAQYR